MKTRTKTRISTKRKKRKTGSSVLAFALLLLGGAQIAVPAGEKRQEPPADAVIAGTVFRPPGLALPGAEVRIEPQARESGAVKLKRAEAVANTRGEFAFRVPTVPAEWVVHVKSNGYESQVKRVSIEGEQRIDLSFLLEPANAKARGDAK